jgi:alpha-glucan phosphorylase-like protein
LRALRHLQARQPGAGRHAAAGLDGQRSQAARAVPLCRQGASARRAGQEGAAADCADDARLRVRDKFVFIEDYDINVGRYLVQGVDVWLNNPRRPLEASGTSGQKVVLNGGLNLSVLDGWWAEAYDGLNGFAIGTGRTHSNMDVHDSRDGEDLYRVLRDEVIPLYYSATATACRAAGSSA